MEEFSEKNNQQIENAEQKSENKGGFFSFQTMITPVIMRILYVLGALALLIYTFFLVGNAMSGYNANGGLALLILVAGAIGQLCWRVLCESMVVFFSIHEELMRIRKGSSGMNT